MTGGYIHIPSLYDLLSIPDSSSAGCIFGRMLDSFHSQNNSFSSPARIFDKSQNKSLTIISSKIAYL
jgi:hypothetical protein